MTTLLNTCNALGCIVSAAIKPNMWYLMNENLMDSNTHLTGITAGNNRWVCAGLLKTTRWLHTHYNIYPSDYYGAVYIKL